MAKPIVTFIGAGSSVFTKNIAGDILSRPALAQAEIRLIDINAERLSESEIIVGKMAATLGGKASVTGVCGGAGWDLIKTSGEASCGR